MGGWTCHQDDRSLAVLFAPTCISFLAALPSNCSSVLVCLLVNTGAKQFYYGSLTRTFDFPLFHLFDKHFDFSCPSEECVAVHSNVL